MAPFTHAAIGQPPGWTSQFRKLRFDVAAVLPEARRLRRDDAILAPNDYTASQALAGRLHRSGADGIVYPSVRTIRGECVALSYPDLATSPRQARHLDYHWDGARVDFYRDAATREVFAVR